MVGIPAPLADVGPVNRGTGALRPDLGVAINANFPVDTVDPFLRSKLAEPAWKCFSRERAIGARIFALVRHDDGLVASGELFFHKIYAGVPPRGSGPRAATGQSQS